MCKVNSEEIYNNQNIENGYLTVEDLTGQTWFNNKDFYESQVLRKYYSQKIFIKLQKYFSLIYLINIIKTMRHSNWTIILLYRLIFFI
ncbi:hypothetical protein J2T20_001901 [Paenibacillus wynnii]|nr:hypothetical protein [Paenibacillus wynnii]